MSPWPSADLIPSALRDQVEAACPRYTLGRIEEIFAAEGFDWPAGFVPQDGRQRRSLVEEFHGSIDFADRREASSYLGVVIACWRNSTGARNPSTGLGPMTGPSVYVASSIAPTSAPMLAVA